MNYRKCKIDRLNNEEFYFHKWFKNDTDKEMHGLLEHCNTGQMISEHFDYITFLDSPIELIKKINQRTENHLHLD